jgi:(p)ppGpp synthase/HD superfamily hydrolase
VTAETGKNVENSIASILSEYGFNVQSVDYEKDASKDEITYTFHIMTRHKQNTKDVFNRLNSIDSINSIKVRG